MKCAIMQPTYLPWAGYFALMGSVDTFIVLDDVEFSRQSWQQRNCIKSQDGAQWLTVPVKVAGNSHQLIRDVEIDARQPWRRKHLNALMLNYAKAAFIRKYKQWLQDVYQTPWRLLCELNVRLVQDVASFLNVHPVVVRSSELEGTGGRVGRLVSYCRQVGANEYLSPPGSAEYINADNQFESAGIRLEYFRYEPAPYTQMHGSFVSHLSALDLLLNEGPASGSVLMAGVRKPYTQEELESVQAAGSGAQ
jgi:hypothetical protein